jgi:WD40 repeat protein
MKIQVCAALALWAAFLIVNPINAQQPDLDQIRAAQWSPDGQLIAYATTLGQIAVVDAVTGDHVWQVSPYSDIGIYTLAWNPEQSLIAVGGDQATFGVLDAYTGQILESYDGHTGTITSVKWKPDGSQVASVQPYGTVRIRTLATGEEMALPIQGDVISVEWKEDGTILAIGGFLRVYFWETATWTYQETLVITDYATAMDWPGNGDVIATTGIGIGNVPGLTLWNVETGDLAQSFSGHTNTVNTVDWRLDEGLIATSSFDGSVRVWDVDSGLPTLVIESDQPIFGAYFSPYGGRLAITSTQQTGSVYALVPGAIEIAIPNPSLDRLADIQAACVADAPGVTTLPAPESTPQPDAIAAVESLAAQDVTSLTIDALPAYITQVESLPEGSIPPACAADLIAVAEAVMAAGSAQSE